MDCREFEDNLAHLGYGELTDEQRALCETHAASCEACRKALEEFRRLGALLSQRPRLEPTPDLIVECRQGLEEALDREELGWHGLVRQGLALLRFRPTTGVAVAASLLAAGFSLGWTLRPRAQRLAPVITPVSSSSMVGDLENMRINGISRVAPDPKTNDVRITLDAERRMTLQGPLDDPRIQQVLVYTMKSYDNPGIRRDTLDALRTRPNVPAVRRALLWSMRHDQNVGVRLEALDAVHGLPWDAELQQAFLDSLEHDTNPGVRVAAVDALATHADEDVLPALERLATHDSNQYVRLKCANAVAKLGR